MAKSLHNTVAFAGGEWSPRLDARVDQQKYGSAQRQCLNLIPYKTGPLTRRPGTQYMGTAKYADAGGATAVHAVRLMTFQFSPTTGYTLEFGHRYVRFYSNGQQVVVSSAPLWAPLKLFVPGSYCTYLGTIYYAPNGALTALAPTAGGVLNVIWFAQTILEQPTPYNGIYYPTNAPPAWTTATIYNPGDYVLQGGLTYRCQVYHNSGVFATDLAAGDWLLADAPLTPWETDIFRVAPCEINDVIYLASPEFPVWSLTRLAETNWLSQEVAFLTPALLDQNATDIKITPSAVQGTGITLTASAPAFVAQNYYQIGNSVEVTGVIYNCIVSYVSTATFANDLLNGYWQAQTVFNNQQIGGTWQLATLRNSAYIEYDGVAATGFAAGTSSSIQALGAWELHTYGVWSGDIALERSLDGGITFSTVRTLTGRSDRNVDLKGNAIQLGIYRLVITNVAVPPNPGATDPRVVFECVDAFLYGLVKITAVSSATVATANVITQLADTNPLATQWSAAGVYLAGAAVSYAFVNYTALHNVGPSATPPSQDTTNWAPTAPGGTEYWSEAAWSNYRGFPRAVASFQQRMIYGGSGYEPQRIWATRTNDIENFALGDQTLATDAFAFDLNAPGYGPIQWLLGQTVLFVGFSGSEWVVSAASTQNTGGNSGAAITAQNINAVAQSTWGSAPGVLPAIVGDAVMFTQRQASSLRQMMFSVYTTKYMSQDLTTLAQHMFPSGIVQMGYQARWRGQSIIWAVTQQGTLCGLTYELDQEVFGWHRHQTGYGQSTPDDPPVPITPDNGFESVTIVDGQGRQDDQVWVVVNRLIGGVQTRFIERINPNNWEETFTGAPNPPSAVLADAFYVDCGKTVLAPGTTLIPGLSYLEGRYVYGLADGYAFGPVLVSGGTAQLPPSIPTTVAKVQIGLPIKYAGQPMRIDGDARAGNTQGLVKQISDLFIRVYNSIGGSVSNGQDDLGINQPVPIPYTSPASPFATPTFVSTPTDIRLTLKGNPSPGNDPVFIVQGNDAKPLTVLAMVLKYDVTATP
jgi:hypothetical protein